MLLDLGKPPNRRLGKKCFLSEKGLQGLVIACTNFERYFFFISLF